MSNKNVIYISVLVLLLSVILTYFVIGDEGFATMWAPTNITNMPFSYAGAGRNNLGVDFLTRCKNGFITKFNIGESDRIWRIQGECSDGEVLPEIGEGGNLKTQVTNNTGFTKLNVRQGDVLENVEFVNGSSILAKRGNTGSMTHTLDCEFGRIIGIRGTVDDNLRQLAVVCGADFDDAPNQGLKILLAMYGLPTSFINVTDSLRTKVVNNSITNLPVNNTSLGISFDAKPTTPVFGIRYLNLPATDPLRTQQPLRLWVVYSINGKTFRIIVPAGQTLNINSSTAANASDAPFTYQQVVPRINPKTPMDYYDGDGRVVNSDTWRNESRMTYEADRTLRFKLANRLLSAENDGAAAGTRIFGYTLASGAVPKASQKWTYNNKKQLIPDHAPSMCLTSDIPNLSQIVLRPCDDKNLGQVWEAKRQDPLVLNPNETVSKNGSLSFTNQYGGSGLEYPMDEGFNIGESEFTIGWWQYQTGGGNPRVFSIGNYPNAVMAVETAGTTFRLWQGGYAVKFDMGNVINTWVNFTVVGNRNNTITIYQNGVAKKVDSDYVYEIESWRGWTQRFSAYQKETSLRFMIGNESIRSANSAFVGLITHFYWKKRDKIELLLYATGDAPFKDSSDKNKVPTNYNVGWSSMSPFVDDSWKVSAGL